MKMWQTAQIPAHLHWDPLHSALAEQRWIERQISSPFTVPQLALVQYPEPAVIFGRKGGDEVARRARAEAEGFSVLQRRTGGGAVLAGPWLVGVHIVLPPAHPVARMAPTASMVWLGKAISTALTLSRVRNALVDSDLIAETRQKAEEAALEWACFAALSHGELLDEHGRKLVGLSQYRARWGVLLSGGLLVSTPPWEALEYVYCGSRPSRSRLGQLASAGVGVVAPTVVLPDLYARLATCLDIAFQADETDRAVPEQGSNPGVASHGPDDGRRPSALANVR